MGIGIQICGLNGCGKSTVGKALARELGFYFIDNENLYFQRTTENEPYRNERPRPEVERLLMEEVRQHENFVFAAVKGDYGAAMQPLYNYVVYLQVPGDVRAWRVRNRSFLKFGERMLPGGDLHEKEEAFFRVVAGRKDEMVENWLNSLSCPVLRLDGRLPVEENVKRIMEWLEKKRPCESCV